MTNHRHIINYLNESQKVLFDMLSEECMTSINQAAELMIAALKNGNKIITCGNGGSMCDAMHFTSELTGRYKDTREPMASIVLSDAAAMSCIGNDFGYEVVFSRQLRGIGKMGDVLLAISTSGRSMNVFRAMEAANANAHMTVVGLTGQFPDGNFVSAADILIKVPSTNTAMIQQAHTTIIHLLVELIEKSLTP